MHSCVYEGWVRHRRFEPVDHQFRYRIYMMYLDLEELPQVFDPYWLWSAHRPALSWFRRCEHLGDPQQPLADAVRDLVARQTGRRVTGPIRLLTSLRQAGFQMNPVSYFYCYDDAGEHVECVVAEVNNTPWGEQHCYVIEDPQRPGSRSPRKVTTQKDFHVSPFMQMQMEYHWRLSAPAQSLNISIQNHRQSGDPASHSTVSAGRPAFDVTMSLQRREISHRSLAAVQLRFPLVTAKVFAGIYWQALKLWWKKVPFVPHPNTVADSTVSHTTLPEGQRPESPTGQRPSQEHLSGPSTVQV